jgi:threonylcarbamoyladenosine tRNA methylthiotransferase MtaB
MRVHLTNLGCKLNQAEIDSLARQLIADRHRIVASLDDADLHVVNTCTVTHVAARTSRKAGRRALRRGARARTVLTGCWVDGSPDEAAALAGVDLVVPNHQKDRLLELVYRRFPAWRPAPDENAAAATSEPYAPLELGPSRALVKIEDGCNMQCSFCIIPTTRGGQRSRPAAAVIGEVRRLAASGHREIVLTVVQISSYRDGEERLATLVRRLLDETDAGRLRLTSIAPWDFDPRLLDLVETGRVCRHFHLSLQSGCDRTLERMRRPYDSRTFAALVDTIRRRLPGVAISTDVIVGFPGETDRDFDESLAFVRETGFARLHAFPYSPRPGTPAARLRDTVEASVRKDRMRRLLDVAGRSERAFGLGHLGDTLEVLWEGRRDGAWRGTSDNYVKVRSTAGRDLRRTLTPTLIERLEAGEMFGRPLAA